MLLVVLWRLRYKLSLRDLAELFLPRGFVFTHEAVREWEARFAPTDGHDAYPRAIRETLGETVAHRTNRYRNNRMEQDHRGVKQRYYPMRGFGSFAAAARCCPACEEQRQYFRARTTMHERVSLGDQRCRFRDRWAAVLTELAAA